jgi:uncharacterized protein (TIGR03083 family)
VDPIAERVRANRSEIVRTAREITPEMWSEPSPDEGWSYKDLLTHVAGDTDKNVQNVLRSVVTGQPVDPALFSDIDAKNARDLEQRRTRSVDELIAEIEHDGETILDLLSQLNEEHASLRQENFPVSLGDALPPFPDHDATHLAQLRTALEVKA